MEKIINHKFFRIFSVFFIMLQFFQPLSQVGATTNEAEKNGVSITTVEQVSSDTLSLSLSTNNTSSEPLIEEINFSDGIKAKVSEGPLINSASNDEIGNYNIEENKLVITTNPGVNNATANTINITVSSFDSSSEQYLELNGSKSQVKALPVQVKESSPIKEEVAATPTLPIAKSTLALAAEPFAGPVDITQYLPESSNGTIIDHASLTAKDLNGNPIDLKEINKDSDLKFIYEYSVPTNMIDDYQIKAGDYFKFTLPENINYSPITTPQPMNDFVTYTISATGEVTLTFTEAVKDSNEISGHFDYTATLVKNSNAGKYTVPIDSTAGPITLDYGVKPSGGKDIEKSGVINDANSSGNNPTKMTWTVSINTTGNQLINATVSDPAVEGTSELSTVTTKVPTHYSAIKVYPQTVNMDGTVTSTGEALVEGVDYTRGSDDKITFIGKYADTYSAFKLVYESDIDTSKVPDDGGKVTFTNTATLTNDGKDSSASSTLVPNYGVLITKKFDGAQDQNQNVNWHIDYNFGQKNLAAGTKLVDTLTAGQVFTGEPKLEYEVGGIVDPSLYTISYNADKTVMTVDFVNGLTKGVKVSYQSHVTDPIDSQATVGNTAESNGQTKEVNGNNIGQQGLSKSLGQVDYNTRIANWSININKARMDMSNWSMTDAVPNGLTLDTKSVVLKDMTSNTTLVQGTDYELTQTSDSFTVKFLGALAAHANDYYKLSYSTSFEPQNLPENKTWTNSVFANWTDQSGKAHKNATQSNFNPKSEYISDATKSGSYDAVTKQFTWTIIGNYNQRTIKEGTITDPIIGDQDYVAGSALLYEATIKPDGSYQKGNLVSDLVPTFDEQTKTVSAKLPEGSTKVYILTFKTSLENKVIGSAPYINQGTYVNNAITTKLSASVTVPNAGNLISKSGKQDSTNASNVIWNVWVNKTQSTIDNAKIIDSPSDNQVIDEASIKVYPTKVASNGKFTEDKANPLVKDKDYSVNLETDNANGKQKLTIQFLNEITSAYSIYYSAFINSSKDRDTLSNTVNITGEGEKEVAGGTSSSTSVVNVGGSSSGRNTTLVVTKKDQNTNTLMPNVTFELWSNIAGKKGQMLRTATTDASGQLAWSNLKSGKYFLVETKTQDGYVISNTLKNGQDIAIDYTNANENNEVSLNVTNLTGKITIEKTDADTGKALADAEFSLYLKGTDEDKLIESNLKTDSNGRISVDRLNAGNYYVVETAVPAGYILDATPHNVTIDGGNIQPTIKITNAEKTGSVALTKTDSDTKATLADAKFSLFKENGTLVKAGLLTDQNGQLSYDGLKPGNYYFQETEAPAGYVLNNNKLPFTVELQTEVKVAQVSAENAEKTGSVVLTKTDSDTGSLLQDATFSLFKEDGTLVKADLLTDNKGQINYDGLKPGNYYFQETKAPAGYVLDNSELPFIIELQTTTKVVQVSATNAQKTGSVVLTKTDGDTKEKLPGAEFSLFDKAGKELQSKLYTDANGEITVDNLKPGDYYFQETKAPAGYDLNTTKVEFTIVLQKTTEVKQVAIENAQTVGQVVLTKLDQDTQKVLADATFDLYNAKGTQIKSDLVSNAQGQISVENLKPGKYYFVETKAPAGYDLDKTPVNFEIELQTTTNVAQVASENAQTVGSVELNKIDADTNKALEGAEFSLFDASDKEVKANLITDENGQIKVNHLKPGKYYFVETKTPAGYDLDETKLPFEIELQTTAKTAVVNAKNEETTGSVKLTKFDKATTEALAGATFNLYNANDELIQSDLKSNLSGEITVDDLKPGNYYFMETAAPAGYSFDAEQKHEFTIEFQDTTKLAEVSVDNEEVTGSVVLTKTDADTGSILPGATFSLFDKEDNEVKTDLVTDENGEIKVDNLKPGEYYFQETAAPAGYDLDDSKLPFTVELQTTPMVATVETKNEETSGSVKLTKFDKDTNEVLPGATFDLYNKANELLQSGLVSDENGEIFVNDLKPGDYYFMETEAPAGYLFNAEQKHEFTIEFQDTPKLSEITVENEQKAGSVVLTKTDADNGNKVKGAEFSLFNMNNELIESGLTTDKMGQIKVNDLKPGDYYFQETEAPAGYLLDDSKLLFTIVLQTTEEVAQVSSENEEISGSVVLTKSDNVTGQTLQGAKFNLYDSEGKLLQLDLTTDVKGQIKVNDLKPGKYYFKETFAPIGYQLDSSSKYEFEIEFQDIEKVAQVNVKNVKIPEVKDSTNNNDKLLATGDGNNIGIMLSGLMLTILGCFVWLKARKA